LHAAKIENFILRGRRERLWNTIISEIGKKEVNSL